MKKFGIQVESFMRQKQSIIIIIIVLFIIVSGIYYSLYLSDRLRYADEKVYYTLATNLAKRHHYSLDNENPFSFRPPGYPLILSAVKLLGAGVFYLRMINFICLGLCIYFLNEILKNRSSALTGLLGALLVVFYPVLFYTAGTLYPQTVASCLFLIILYLLTKTKKSYLIFVLSGLLFGLLILTIPVFIVCLFIMSVWFWFFEDSNHSKRILITLAVAFIPIGAWCVRNYMVYKSFVLISTNSGFMLILGNSENTTPNAGPDVDTSKYGAELSQMQLNDVEKDAYCRSKAVEWIVNHKAEALKLYCLKFLNHFNYRNYLATQSETSRIKDFVMLITYGPLLLLFICRILLLARFKPSAFEILLIVLYLSSAAFYAIFFTRIRYRLPFDFLLIAIDAIFLHRIFFGRGIEPKCQKP